MSKVEKKVSGEQMSLLSAGENNVDGKEEAKTVEKAKKKQKVKKPATELMKKVAARTMNEKNMEKVFTKEEIEDILMKRDAGEDLTSGEHKALRDKYRKMKYFAKDLEAGNKEKIVAIPSIVQGGEFYKVFDFSALYYVYRLASRMGRNARLMRDTDRFAKMPYAASFVNMGKFIEQFKRLEGSEKIEKTEDGIYIFTLKTPLSDDEVGELRMVEETRRERLHNVLRPKAMEPAVFQAILMVVRQVGPRVRKLEKQYYLAIGEEMLKNLNLLLAKYFDFANGVIGRAEVGREIMMIVDSLFAGLAILSELRIWDYGIAASIGENINELKRLALKEFNVKATENG